MATIFSRMSKDLSMDIFSRLPSNSVGMSKCVCKEWKKILSNPFFKSLHRQRSSQKPNVLLVQTLIQSDCNSDFYTLIGLSSVDFDGNLIFDYKFTIDACCVLFLSSNGEIICFATEIGIHLYNPTTRELVNLGKPPGLVFGYIKERNEYVLFSTQHSKSCYIVRLTDDCCLKEEKVVAAKPPCCLSTNAVLVANCFYWMSESIVSFDLGKEEFGTLMSPVTAPFYPYRVQRLVELKGMLCLTNSYTCAKDIWNLKDFKMDIWVLKDFKNCTWVKELTIDLSVFELDFLGNVILLHHMGEKILMYVKSIGLVWYDVENKCFKIIHNHKGISGGCTWCTLFNDGLFSLGSDL